MLQEDKIKNGQVQVFTNNLRSETKDGWEQEFYSNESFRVNQRKDSVAMYHEIVSFSKNEDKNLITKEILEDIARKYIEYRGKDGVYFGTAHIDNQHVHLHFCISGLSYRTGKSFRISKAELQQVKIKLTEYHRNKYPELKHSFPEHCKGGMYKTNREWQAMHHKDRTLLKEEIRQTVQDCYLKSNSQEDFLNQLRNNDIHYYERNGVATGVIVNDLKIRFSRLDISYDKLRSDRTEEMVALTEIRKIRTKRERAKDLIEKEIQH
jgi:hypothetical protein